MFVIKKPLKLKMKSDLYKLLSDGFIESSFKREETSIESIVLSSFRLLESLNNYFSSDGRKQGTLALTSGKRKYQQIH